MEKQHPNPVTTMLFSDLQEAWEGMNEYLFIEEKKIVDTDTGGAFGSQMVCHDTIIVAHKAEVNQNFDFGRLLGYSPTKWTTLVNNYVDYHYLDMLREEVLKRERSKARMYNYTLHFSNKYGSGKDCLISLTLARRPNRKRPFASFVIRTSEITKRLLFDMLLVQRIIEYVYGHNDVEVHLYAQHWYITAESFIMFNNIRSVEKLRKLLPKKLERFQKKIMEKFEEFMYHPDPHNVMFRVNRRSMLQIQKGKDGLPLSGVKPMLASSLKLKIKEPMLGIITKKQLNQQNRDEKRSTSAKRGHKKTKTGLTKLGPGSESINLAKRKKPRRHLGTFEPDAPIPNSTRRRRFRKRG